MSTVELLTELRRSGVQFTVDGSKLRVIIPQGVVLPEAVKSEIRHRKTEILSQLRSSGSSMEDVMTVFPRATVEDASTDAKIAADEEPKRHEAEVSAALAEPGDQLAPGQPELQQQARPLPSTLSADAAYWTARFNETLDAWRRKDYGPCIQCGQTARHDQLGFTLCSICLPKRTYKMPPCPN